MTPAAEPYRRDPFELTSDAGLPIRGQAVHPYGAALGAVIVCHGWKGFARWGFFPYLADELARMGLRAITFNFSGSGVGADGESFSETDAFFHDTFSRELADVALVQREADARGWLPARFGLFGHSRGGGIAVLHASREPRVGAVVTWAAISHVRRWSADEVAQWRERGYAEVTNARTGQVLRLGTAILDDVERNAGGELDIPAAAARVRAPWLIVHGTDDETVPYAEAERLRDASGGHARLAPIGRAGHTFDARHPLPAPMPFRLERAAAMTVAFFRQHLAPPAAV